MSRAVVPACTALLLAGCFTTTGDFRRDAEEYIRSDDELSTAVGVTFTSATCQEPDDRDVGTTFACSAIDDQGRTWEFLVEITDENEFTVNVDRRP